MSVLVVDACVAVKWFLGEEQSEAALGVLRGGHELHAPDLLFLEMDSVLGKLIRRGVVRRDEADAVRKALRVYRISVHASSSALLDAAWDIACGTGAGIYDSVYLALARHLGAPLVTADRKLCRVLARGPLAKSILWVEDVT